MQERAVEVSECKQTIMYRIFLIGNLDERARLAASG